MGSRPDGMSILSKYTNSILTRAYSLILKTSSKFGKASSFGVHKVCSTLGTWEDPLTNETRDYWNTSLLSRDVRSPFPLMRNAYSDVNSFGGDSAKCDELNKLLCQKAGFKDCYVSSKHGPDDLQSANPSNS